MASTITYDESSHLFQTYMLNCQHDEENDVIIYDGGTVTDIIDEEYDGGDVTD